MSVHWLGDFVFVESGLGVRVKFDLNNMVYLTVTAEHLAATRGLCGVYNNDADGISSVFASVSFNIGVGFYFNQSSIFTKNCS